MIASVHLACGAASGIFVQKNLPVVFKKEYRCLSAFLAGIFSHIILDAWPHWEYSQTGPRLLVIVFVETLAVFFSVFGISKSRIVNYTLFCGMVGGALPDLSLMIWEKVFFWNPLLYFHFMMHVFHGSLPVFQIGWFFQIILAIIAIRYVKLKSA